MSEKGIAVGLDVKAQFAFTDFFFFSTIEAFYTTLKSGGFHVLSHISLLVIKMYFKGLGILDFTLHGFIGVLLDQRAFAVSSLVDLAHLCISGRWRRKPVCWGPISSSILEVWSAWPHATEWRRLKVCWSVTAQLGWPG